jgi:hypothetical protein
MMVLASDSPISPPPLLRRVVDRLLAEPGIGQAFQVLTLLSQPRSHHATWPSSLVIIA